MLLPYYQSQFPTVQILPIIIRLAMTEPPLEQYMVMRFWSKPNAYLAIPESEMMPHKQALILIGGVTTVLYLLDTSYFPHCLLICANCKPEDIYRQAHILQSRAINIGNDSHARTKWGCIHQRIRFRTSVSFKRGNRDNH